MSPASPRTAGGSHGLTGVHSSIMEFALAAAREKVRVSSAARVVGPDGTLFLMDIDPQLNVAIFPELTAR